MRAQGGSLRRHRFSLVPDVHCGYASGVVGVCMRCCSGMFQVLSRPFLGVVWVCFVGSLGVFWVLRR